MTRAQLLKDAIIDGLDQDLARKDRADLVRGVRFEERCPVKGVVQVVAHCPRTRLNLESPAPIEHVVILRDAIEDGLRANGFMDAIIIEP